MDVQKQIYAKATAANANIILAEADDPRVIEAAQTIISENLAHLTLIGNKEKITANLGEKNEKISIVDPQTDITDSIITAFQEYQPKETSNKEEIQKILSHDTKTLAAVLVRMKQADGYVAGNLCATAETIRPALRIIGTTDGFASSYFLMVKEEKVMVFADCAFNVDPTPEQLAKIGVDTAKSATAFNIEPRIAFLSFSTKGSAQHPRVDKVRRACEIAKTLSPEIPSDGEMQFDTAIVASVGKQKAPDSAIAGNANILIFPDLDSGNIAYKVAQRLSGYSAIGPIMQGFHSPVNDLSRGCTAQDIVDVVAVTAMQVGEMKKSQ